MDSYEPIGEEAEHRALRLDEDRHFPSASAIANPQAVEIRSIFGFRPVGRADVAIVTVVPGAVAAILLVQAWPGLILAAAFGTALGPYAVRTFPRDQLSALLARIARRGKPADLASTASKP